MSGIEVTYVLGTRPELIRSAPILKELGGNPLISLTVVNTGQHFDHNMSQGFLDYFDLPTADLSLGIGGKPRAEQVVDIIGSLVPVFRSHPQTCVCVFGDTNSCLGAALAAQMCEIPVVHIEAGARSYDMTLPEEVNRRIIDHIADLLLTVSPRCTEQLRSEAVPGAVVETGDPLYETLMAALGARGIERSGKDRRRCLLTLHRQALVDSPDALLRQLIVIDDAAGELGLRVLFPVHPRAARTVAGAVLEHIELMEPLLYEQMVMTLALSCLVVTDSGGLQKEAFWTGTPCVTVRHSTEWGETVESGYNVLATGLDVGAAMSSMVEKVLDIPSGKEDPFLGVGASRRIADAIEGRYG